MPAKTRSFLIPAASLVLWLGLVAGQQQPQQQQPALPSTTPSSLASSSPQTNSSKQPAASLGSLVSSQSGQQPKNSASQLDSMFLNEQQDQSLSPFADDSLWRIPVHFARDEQPAKPAAATNNNVNKNYDQMDDLDEDDEHDSQPVAQSAPTVISASTDLKTAAGYSHPTHNHYEHHDSHHHDQHYKPSHHHGADYYGGKYFQYASVPYPYSWDFGYRRGNPYHTIERYEHGKGPHFQTKVKWSDKHGGYGVHVWDYNHDDHHYDHHAKYPEEHHHYGGHKPSYGHHYDPKPHHGSHYGHH